MLKRGFMRVELSDFSSNRQKRFIGISYGYLFAGPFYLLVRLRIVLALFLLVFYFYLLLIPFMEYVEKLFLYIPFDANGKKILHDVLFFFRTGFDQLNVYVGILSVVLIHIFFTLKIDNFILKRIIAKKKLAPYSKEDAEKLIYYHVAKPGVKLVSELLSIVEKNSQAEQIWEEKNLSYTTMLSKTEIMNQAKPRKKKVKNLQGISTSTSEVVNAQLENTGNQYKLSQYRRLYSEGKISAEEFELLEKNLNK